MQKDFLFENFTLESVEAVLIAQQEAYKPGHCLIGAEHILTPRKIEASLNLRL